MCNIDLWPIGFGLGVIAIVAWEIFRHSKWYVDRE